MSLYYKPSFNESVDRLSKLWAREALDRICVKIEIENPKMITTLNAMSKVPDKEEMVKEWEKGFLLNKDIKDDNLPVLYGEYGSYIIGGFLGAEVIFGRGGAFPKPLIKDMNKYEKYLNPDIENNEYYKMQINYIKYLSNISEGKFGFTEMFIIDGLNFLECLRGGNAYTDIYDYPAESKAIMDFGSDLNIKLVKEQRKYIKKYRNGRFNFFGIWTPVDTVFTSVDANGHCPPNTFKEFGKKYVNRLADEFGGQWLHLHTESMSTFKNLPEYASLKNLIAIGFIDWPSKPPRGIEVINDIIKITKDVPLMVDIKKKEFQDMIEMKTLPGNILYWIDDINNVDEANKVAAIAYSYRAKYKSKLY